MFLADGQLAYSRPSRRGKLAADALTPSRNYRLGSIGREVGAYGDTNMFLTPDVRILWAEALRMFGPTPRNVGAATKRVLPAGRVVYRPMSSRVVA